MQAHLIMHTRHTVIKNSISCMHALVRMHNGLHEGVQRPWWWRELISNLMHGNIHVLHTAGNGFHSRRMGQTEEARGWMSGWHAPKSKGDPATVHEAQAV